MKRNTHEAGGVLCSIVGFALLKHQGYLLPDVNEAVQWLVMYPFCLWGSVASDLDHNPDSIPKRDVVSKVVNKTLHITHPIVKVIEKHHTEAECKHNPIYRISKFLDAKHRSWQTHSDFTLVVLILLLKLVQSGKLTFLSPIDISLISLVLMAVTTGVVAHFILDMLTPEGVWFTPFVILNGFLGLFNPKLKVLPAKVHLVPHRQFFATGGKWEDAIRKVLKVLTVLAILWFLWNLIYPMIKDYIPYNISFG